MAPLKVHEAISRPFSVSRTHVSSEVLCWEHVRFPPSQKQNHPPQQLLSVQIRQELLSKDVEAYQGTCKIYIRYPALAAEITMWFFFIQLL